MGNLSTKISVSYFIEVETIVFRKQFLNIVLNEEARQLDIES